MNLLTVSLISVSILSVLGAPLYFAFKNAVVGYEDEHGFHLGEQSAPIEATLPFPREAAAAVVHSLPKKLPVSKAATPEFSVVASA